MWIRTKNEALVTVRKLKEFIPTELSGWDEDWARFHREYEFVLKDLQPATGLPPDHVMTPLDTAKGEDHSFVCRQMNTFIDLWCEWIERGFDRGDFPLIQQQNSSMQSVKGWWYFANGERAFLRVWNIDIDLTSAIEKTGRGYPLVLLEMLSWPKAKSITEEEFIKTAEVRKFISKKDYEIARGALDDARVRINKIVNENISKNHSEMKDKDFIIKIENKYQVNDVWL